MMKNAFPTDLQLHAALDSGSETVGNYLEQVVSQVISPEDVLAARYLEDLQKRAEEMLKIKNLYNQWCLISKGEVIN
jgi:hypothetical protein